MRRVAIANGYTHPLSFDIFFILFSILSVVTAWVPPTLVYPSCSFHNRNVQALKSAVPVDDDSSLPKPTPQASSSEYVWQFLQRNFQGDFDNYNQVIKDRENGFLPRDGGGHENFHCTLIPVSDTGRLAAFYFDGNPLRIFRFRYYQLLPIPTVSKQDCVEMRLYTLKPDLEALLRQHSANPLAWPGLFSAFDNGAPIEDKINYLPNCEISWSQDMDPVQHSYITTTKADSESCLHAVMVHGEAIVDSTVIPGIKIRILDQLSLFDDVFYINDRGLDPETGAFIYGNQRGVPYRLERVATLHDNGRTIVNDDLAWTLGDSWRSPQEYDARIAAAGGASVQMRAPPKPDVK